ncbi:hypothetical protein ABZV75_10525 [Streptomyces flaveolus]|uniref:hypothetical protein n=1 Tax=Streptomyces flaveolus TaxID=67297 RepID=UPI0033B5B8FA
MPPSALTSSAASAIASARASASAAACSAAARAPGFGASVDAEAARAGTAAENALKNVQGRGDAVSESLPRNQTGGLPAVLVTIKNTTNQKASDGVHVDVPDSVGKVAETGFTEAEHVEPGHKEQPIAFSRQPQGARLTARPAKARRY